MIRHLASIAVVGGSLMGCATFSDLPSPARHSRIEIPTSSPLSDLDLYVKTAYDPGEESWPHAPQPVEAHKGYAVEALRYSGWFSRVVLVDDPELADLQLRIKKYQTAIKGGFWSILTLFIVPSAADWHLSVTFTRVAGGESNSCTRSVSYRTWTELFLLPFSFTRTQSRYERKAVQRMSLACVEELLHRESL